MIEGVIIEMPPAGSRASNVVCFGELVLVLLPLAPLLWVTPPVLRFVEMGSMALFLVVVVCPEELAGAAVEVAEEDSDASSARTTRESSSGSHPGHDKAETAGDRDKRATTKWAAERGVFMTGILQS
jgi:hypothetical protein